MRNPFTTHTLLLTLLALLAPAVATAQTQVVVTDADIEAGQDVLWTNDNIYLLDGLVFAEDGARLTIEPGTVIWGKAAPTSGDPASALIIARGAQIFADGTASQPIIFTAEGDDPNDPNDFPLDLTGQWGGVILLGSASTNRADEGQIEGISELDPRGAYGGSDDQDDSGILRYVSIRHGGAVIGANNEINGLTLGGVGAGTTIEFVEVIRNADDGFEWFGGTVETRYLVSAFNADDGFDWDEGFRGKGQFWFVLQATEDGDSAAEMDGGTTPEDGQPYATPEIYNATYIGRGAASPTSNRALRFRDNSGGSYVNSIFTDFGRYFASVEDKASGEDSQARLDAGQLVIRDNVIFGFNQGLVGLEDTDAQDNQASLTAYLEASAEANRFVDPQLEGISRQPDGLLDPRPAPGSEALSGAATVPADGFFTQTSYVGAFGPGDPWIRGWSFLSSNGYLNPLITPVEALDEVPSQIALRQNYPNPFNPSTTIEFAVDRAQRVRLAVFDLLGREVALLMDEQQPTGTYRVTFDASDLASGLYLYQLRTEQGTFTRKMMLVK